MAFCQACGKTLEAGAQFCANCGARTASASTPAQPSTPAPSASQPAAQQPTSGGCGKILAVIVIIVLLIVGAIGGVVYWGYLKAKEKVAEVKKDVTTNIKTGGVKLRPGDELHDQEESCPPSDRASLDFEHGTIPMIVGLTMAKTWSKQAGDTETLTQVRSIDDQAVHVTASSGKSDIPGEGSKGGARNICIADLHDGTFYVTGWGGNSAETMRGATMFSLSQKEFQALKSTGETPFTYYDQTERVPMGGYLLKSKSEGQMKRVEPDDVPYSVIVNDKRVDIPTIHAKGMLSGSEYELHVVDDPKSPIVLHFEHPANRFQIKILKISYPEEKKIEKQLEETGKVLVYGIYFDFNSANIREESEPVLKEIADALKAHPDWKLSVNGHTDNVGGNAYNLKLSDKRAAAVKQALVERYEIGPDRLDTAGFGAGSPIETNETPEGRARNRRVELIKR